MTTTASHHLALILAGALHFSEAARETKAALRADFVRVAIDAIETASALSPEFMEPALLCECLVEEACHDDPRYGAALKAHFAETLNAPTGIFTNGRDLLADLEQAGAEFHMSHPGA